MKYKVFIFGTMEESQMVRFDLKENVELLGYLDNKKDCHEKGPLDGVPVMEPIEIKNKSFNFASKSYSTNKGAVKTSGCTRICGNPIFLSFRDGEKRRGGGY